MNSIRGWLGCACLLVTIGCLGDQTSGNAGTDDEQAAGTNGDATAAMTEPNAEPAVQFMSSDAGTSETGRYGDPCETDDDCVSLLCVTAGVGKICSTPCLRECEPFPSGEPANCRSDPSRGRIEFVCYPNQNLLCQPCENDTQCDGQVCLETPEGKRCSMRCSGNNECPDEYTCENEQCRPSNGSCDCKRSSAGETRVCDITNEFGTCVGEQTCDPELGWSACVGNTPAQEICDGVDQDCDGIADDGLTLVACETETEFGRCEGVSVCIGDGEQRCSAPDAIAEACDGLDNDCDGAVDEEFLGDDGQFSTDAHCGVCGIDCANFVPNATTTGCKADGDTYACAVVECEPGYRVLEERACIPIRDVTCESCLDDETCSSRSPGSACVPIGDPDVPETVFTVCGRDCSPESVFGQNCPDGFRCQDFGGGRQQCLPSSGHCVCRDNADGFSVPCSVPHPTIAELTCGGRRRCTNGDFGNCELPEDTCDGIDNDCDGTVDNDFLAADGRYSLDPAHCGRCDLNCSLIRYPNAEATCDISPEIPRCVMGCNEGFVDVENGTDDGCECEILSDADTPDGIDRNCDGIDGDRATAIFVSKVGSDDADGSLEAPLLSITEALAKATREGNIPRDIYVATGVYSENINLVDGVSVYGGYALGFRSRDPSEHPTTLLGRPTGMNEAATVTARNISRPTRLDGFSIYGANATIAGANSIALLIVDSSDQFAIQNNEIFAGNGAPGSRGLAGNSGLAGTDGRTGTNALSSGISNCGGRTTAGGEGGTLICDGQNVSGGRGGTGQCPQSQEIDGNTPCSSSRAELCRNSCNAEMCDPLPPPQGVGTDGQGTGVAPAGAPTYDRWTNLGECNLCGLAAGLPHRGQPGAEGPEGTDGVLGQGCMNGRGTLANDLNWQTTPGSAGQIGTNGTGGGGGSAGSGLDAIENNVDPFPCADTLGAGGGGGGSGGCGGKAGGGGQGGGGSFAVLMTFSAGGPVNGTPRLTGNTVSRGIGGNGGTGGAGGIGGLGGEGAIGGLSQGVFCAEPGGRGGNGGDGGHGGGGGGGCGGISVGIYVWGAPNLAPDGFVIENNLLPSGRGGRGGQGGGSTGNPGTAGADGLSIGVSVQ